MRLFSNVFFFLVLGYRLFMAVFGVLILREKTGRMSASEEVERRRGMSLARTPIPAESIDVFRPVSIRRTASPPSNRPVSPPTDMPSILPHNPTIRQEFQSLNYTNNTVSLPATQNLLRKDASSVLTMLEQQRQKLVTSLSKAEEEFDAQKRILERLQHTQRIPNLSDSLDLNRFRYSIFSLFSYGN